MSRKEEILKLLNNDPTYIPLVDEMMYLEETLEGLRKLPKIKVCPEHPERQKATPAAKLYKEYLQQYANIIRILMKATGTNEDEETSPLRKWMNEHINQ